jgi:hypothetical protein
VINAEGEYQAAAKLAEAAEVIEPNPVTIQLRYLQALSEISGNQGSTIVFPLPLDMLRPLLQRGGGTAAAERREEPGALPEGERREESGELPEAERDGEPAALPEGATQPASSRTGNTARARSG